MTRRSEETRSRFQWRRSEGASRVPEPLCRNFGPVLHFGRFCPAQAKYHRSCRKQRRGCSCREPSPGAIHCGQWPILRTRSRRQYANPAPRAREDCVLAIDGEPKSGSAHRPRVVSLQRPEVTVFCESGDTEPALTRLNITVIWLVARCRRQLSRTAAAKSHGSKLTLRDLWGIFSERYAPLLAAHPSYRAIIGRGWKMTCQSCR